MTVKIDKAFQKDVRKLNNKAINSKISSAIGNVQMADNVHQIKNLKKLKGTTSSYRVKIGDYSLGIIIHESSVEFIRCLHRKDIYKYFPK